MLPNSEGSVTATELRRSSHNIQLEVMRTWFYSTYEDPAEITPFESAEGGYIYIWGGPYDPEKELHDEFGGLIPDMCIEELATELRDICWEWTPHPECDDIDDYFFESIAQTTEHRESFNEAIANVEHLLTSDAIGTWKKYLLRLLYVNVITILETYLSDLFISAVGNDRSLLRRFVETTPEFKSEKISVSEVFKAVEDIEKMARSYLMDVVWHHLSRVKPMFKETLDIKFPNKMEILFKAVLVRHDLVHRNGKKKDGGEHDISVEIITELIKEAGEFVSHIDKQWPEGLKSNNCDAED
jgi:hypothetical protein